MDNYSVKKAHRLRRKKCEQFLSHITVCKCAVAELSIANQLLTAQNCALQEIPFFKFYVVKKYGFAVQFFH